MDSKVPVKERLFLLDQRSERKMVIGNVDKLETVKIEKRLDRKERDKCRASNVLPILVETVDTSELVETTDLVQPAETVEPQVTEPSTSRGKRNLLACPYVARVCDRCGLSVRSAAAVASAVLQDVGLVNDINNTTLVIDKNKIHRALSKSRDSLSNKYDGVLVHSIYFDGRKDKTLVSETKDGRNYRKEVLEEHISILTEPESLFLGHITPKSGTGKEISSSILDFLKNKEFDLKSIVCIGCDGTATNTGWKGGVISYMEKELGRPLQWAICLLHANELPLRHLFTPLGWINFGTSIVFWPDW